MTTSTLEEELSQLEQQLAAINVARESFFDYPNESDRRNYLTDPLRLAQHPYLRIIYSHQDINELDGEYKIKMTWLADLLRQRRPIVNDNEGKLTNTNNINHCL